MRDVKVIEVTFVQDDSGSSAERTREARKLIAQMIELSHKRGRPAKEEEDRKKELRVSHVSRSQFVIFLVIGIAGTTAFGALASRLSEWMPSLFSKPSAFPYLDSFVTVMSIVATYLMVQKKVECWAMWIIVDAVACGLYFAKEIKFVGLEYLVFCFLAGFGLWNWAREYKLNHTLETP